MQGNVKIKKFTNTVSLALCIWELLIYLPETCLCVSCRDKKCVIKNFFRGTFVSIFYYGFTKESYILFIFLIIQNMFKYTLGEL
jgi:hypothetical protein